ncbi:hypothetical protein NORO109296_19860 [Nocardiopsis rhodophaea]
MLRRVSGEFRQEEIRGFGGFRGDPGAAGFVIEEILEPVAGPGRALGPAGERARERSHTQHTPRRVVRVASGAGVAGHRS